MSATSAESIAEPKKRRVSCSCLILIFALLITAAAFYVACIYTPPLRISEETTRITGPLTPDGQIDFLRYLEETNYPPELATDENGFRIFVRTFGDIAGNDAFYSEQKYKKLGLDINVKPTMVFPKSADVIVTKYYKKLGETPPQEKFRLTYNKPWTLEELPMLTDWIASIDVPLDAAAEMIHKPIFFLPYQNEESFPTGKSQILMTIFSSDAQMVRHVARCYQVRANYRIAAGNINGAIDDAITLHQLGQKVAQDGILIQMIVGIAIEGAAYAVPFAANSDHQPTKEQLQRLLDAVNQHPLRQSMENAFEFDRVVALSTLQDIYLEDGYKKLESLLPNASHPMIASLLNIGLNGTNQNVAFRYLNEAYDTVTGKRPRSEYANYCTLPFSSFDDAWLFATPGGRGKLLGRAMANTFLAIADATEKAAQRTDCCCNLKRLTLALLLYKNEYGEFPKADWIEKIKPYLGDDFERYLRCPSCSSAKEGETNYALILYDKLPEDRGTLLLVERNASVPYSEAAVSAAEVLQEMTKKIGSSHPDGINTARQNGAVRFIDTMTHPDELRKLIGLETKTNKNTE